MLRSISHSRARAVTNCPACRALSSASSASASLTVAAASSSRLASARPRLSLHDNRRTTSWSTRAVATEAQQSLQVEEEDLEPAPLTEAEEMDALLASFEQQMAPESPTASPPSPPEPEPEPTAPAAPLFSPSLLLSTFPQGPPTSSDLDSLAPRNFNILDASSPESHRIIYAKKWNSSFARLDSAFTKRQLLVLVDSPQPEGLGLNLLDPRYKASVKGKKNKHWKPKKATQMTKRELGHAIMVLHWEMPNPETLPTPRKGPQKVDGESRVVSFTLRIVHRRARLTFAPVTLQPSHSLTRCSSCFCHLVSVPAQLHPHRLCLHLSCTRLHRHYRPRPTNGHRLLLLAQP